MVLRSYLQLHLAPIQVAARGVMFSIPWKGLVRLSGNILPSFAARVVKAGLWSRAAVQTSSSIMMGTKVFLSTAGPEKSLPVNKKRRLVWFDLEMTGLNPDEHHIIEAACLVTDSDLNIVGEGIDVIIHHSDDVLNGMNDWCKTHFAKSGLTESCRSSTVSLSQAESMILSFLEEHTIKGASPCAGNTVYMDRLFLRKYMPRVNDQMHYRIVDVSSVKELCRRWAPKTFEGAPKKKLAHRALEDIKESIIELKYYKDNFLKKEL